MTTRQTTLWKATRQTTLWRAEVHVLVFGWAFGLIWVRITRVRMLLEESFGELWMLTGGTTAWWIRAIIVSGSTLWSILRGSLGSFVNFGWLSWSFGRLGWGSWFRGARFIHCWLGKLVKVLAQREKSIPWVLGILEQEISVVWFFFFDDDTGRLWFGYGGWSGDHEEVMLWT